MLRFGYRYGRNSLILILFLLVICLFCATHNWRTLLHEASLIRETIRSPPNILRKTFHQKHKFIENECNVNTKPHKSIFYIKVHKTASTTLRSTLLIYGREYNLTICMDSTDKWGLNWPYRVDNLRLTKMHEEKCQLIAEELVYTPEIVNELMGENTFVLASVRHPVQHFMSLFKYSNIQKAVEKLLNRKLSQWDAIRVFLKHNDIIQNMYASYEENEVRDKLQLNLIRPNLQMFSLGLKHHSTTYEIEQRASEIDFIVVAEKYDESMIILREKLCCSVEDVLYRKQNVRQSESEKKIKIPKDIRDEIVQFNLGDMYLYNLAQSQLYKNILKHPLFKNLLNIYRYELDKYEQKCNDANLAHIFKERFCPPKDGAIGIFIEQIRNEQREVLTKKLRAKYTKQQ